MADEQRKYFNIYFKIDIASLNFSTIYVIKWKKKTKNFAWN